MKKTLTAAAICAMLSPLVAQADAQLYSSVRLAATQTDNQDLSLGNASSRFGIRAARDIGGGNKMLGRYEWGVNAATGDITGGGTVGSDALGNAIPSSPSTNRLSFIGAEGGWGQLIVGSVWSTYWDFARVYGCYATVNGCLNDGTARSANALRYTGTWGGFRVGIMPVLEDGVNQVQAGAAFNLAGFGVSAAIDSKDNDYDRTGVALTYAIAGIDLQALFTNTAPEVGGDKTELDITAAYNTGPHSLYGQFHNEDTDGGLDGDGYTIEYIYSGIPKTKIGLAIADGDDGVQGSSQTLYFRHDF